VGCLWGRAAGKLFVENAFAHWRTRGFPHYELEQRGLSIPNLQICWLTCRSHASGRRDCSNQVFSARNFFQTTDVVIGVSRYYESPADVFMTDAMFGGSRSSVRLTDLARSLCANPATLKTHAQYLFLRRRLRTNFRPNPRTKRDRALLKGRRDRSRLLRWLRGAASSVLWSQVAATWAIEPCSPKSEGLRRNGFRAPQDAFRTPRWEIQKILFSAVALKECCFPETLPWIAIFFLWGFWVFSKRFSPIFFPKKNPGGGRGVYDDPSKPGGGLFFFFFFPPIPVFKTKKGDSPCFLPGPGGGKFFFF